MLRKGTYEGNNMDGFFHPEEFAKNFKGLYFRPKAEAQSPEESSLIQFKLSESGMILYGRNRNEVDPTLIQDTTASLYYFLDKYATTGKASINTIRHNYAGSLLEGLTFEEKETERSLTEVCYVEGLAGVITLLFGDSVVSFLLTDLPAIEPVVERFLLPFEMVPVFFSGTGDLFSGILTGRVLDGMPLQQAVQRAMDAIRVMILRHKDNEDHYVGIPIETCLDVLN